LSLFLLSAAALAFEINLTRLFSIAQFYHFAFMIVSIALLGYGASGTALTIFPSLQRGRPSHSILWLSLATAFSILFAYLLINWLPFDSYSLIWDIRQPFILTLHYIVLAAPFFFTGMALAILLSRFPSKAGSTYAVNLLGSAIGCLIALLAPAILGAEGMLTLSSLLAIIASLAAFFSERVTFRQPKVILISLTLMSILTFCMLDLSLRIINHSSLRVLDLHISPYKSLSYALQVPGAQVVDRRSNAFSRIDVVRSPGIHSLPGLSYRYLDPLPTLDGLFLDGDDLSPLIQSSSDLAFTSYLPTAIAFQLRPLANALILEPRGGLDILTAFAMNSGNVTAVEVNPLVIRASPAYANSSLVIHQESDRSYLQRTQDKFDVILLSISASYHPVQSGAYSLAEDYRYTVESFQDMLAHLKPGGLLVSMRWLQDPPTEDLRLFALAVTALENTSGDPNQQIVAFRGFNTATLLIKNGAFSPDELAMIGDFTSSRAFDLTYAPGIQANQTNLYNILPQSIYYQTYLQLLESVPRQAFYDSYEYDVRPPTDDHPFFGHYFKWSQTSKILAEFGKAWLPFGGGGYFVILALLILALLVAGSLILLPVGVWKLRNRNLSSKSSPFRLRSLVYFGLLGFAFLFVEIPLLQRFILYLGNPAYALTLVLFSLLLFSALGSRLSNRISLLLSLAALAILVMLMPFLLGGLFEWTLGLPLPLRLIVAVLSLAPLGFLMGIPFPSGINRLTADSAQSLAADETGTPRSDISWVWAVNGAASVISPILAALLALSFGFSFVIWVGALCYLLAMATVWVWSRRSPVQSPRL
jgi:hypothetical protein